MSAPERIWATSDWRRIDQGKWWDANPGGDSEEYVRADTLTTTPADVAGLVKRLRNPVFYSHPTIEDGVEAADALTALSAERDALKAERAAFARLCHAIAEASAPDFLWGAMDNVTDMDTTLDDYAKAASRAIRAAVLGEGGKP